MVVTQRVGQRVDLQLPGVESAHGSIELAARMSVTASLTDRFLDCRVFVATVEAATTLAMTSAKRRRMQCAGQHQPIRRRQPGNGRVHWGVDPRANRSAAMSDSANPCRKKR